jgi:hypothetical protein
MNNRLDVIKHWYSKNKSISYDDLEWIIGYAEESLKVEDDLRKQIEKLYSKVTELEGIFVKNCIKINQLEKEKQSLQYKVERYEKVFIDPDKQESIKERKERIEKSIRNSEKIKNK